MAAREAFRPRARGGSRSSTRVTIDRSKLDAFLISAKRIERISLRVGILEGRTRYPRKRQHDPDDKARLAKLSERGQKTTRLAAIRQLRKKLRDLEAREGVKAARAAEKKIRAEFKAQGISSKGLRRTRGGRGTAVAKVAGVHQAGTSYHTAAFDRRRPAFRRELEELQKVLMDGGNPAPMVLEMGRRFVAEIRRSIDMLDLKETGLLKSTVDFEIVDVPATQWRRRVARQRRAAIRGRRSRTRRRS